MAVSFFRRVIRQLRATSAHIAAFILFSGLLTYIFILYQPTKGPGDQQQLGWQSWEIVSPNTGSQKPVEDAVSSSSPLNNSTDWWDVEVNKESSLDTSSLPLTYWNPLLPHDTGLTEIAVTRCMIPPWYADVCWPKSTVADTSNKGKWVRVERNINWRSGPWYLNMYYRRTRCSTNRQIVSELRLLPKDGEGALPDRNSWYSAGTSVRDGVPGQPPLYLWWKLGPTLRGLNQNETRNLVTELDVVYGAGSPMYGFETLDPEVTAGRGGKVDPIRIAFRRGPPSIPRAPPLHVNRDGTYKILQVADLHFSVSHGKCRDTDRKPCEQGDDLTSDLLSTTLDAEKPDLVVFTGDQLNGQGTSWDSRSVLAKFATPVIERQIPWTAVFGNHDTETDMSRGFEMKHLTQLPYFVGEAGPEAVHGVGNFVLKVRSADASKTHLLTLYLLDSGSYDSGFFDFFGFVPTSYDYLKDTQIEWFLSESAKISPIKRPFVPDGARDLGNLWKRQAVLPSESRLAKPNAMMFFHIPLPEASSICLSCSIHGLTVPDIDPSTGKDLDVGQQLDGPGAAKKNAGFFVKALLNATEDDGGHGREVKVVGNGHCHVSENCRRVRGVWMCFGGGGSYSGYGKVGFDRRFRVYNISDYGETIQTYKRTEHGDIMDTLILTGVGAAPPYEGLRRT
ncbi:Metallo-dependent phosphatase-like protein [Gautieria morchelliformis]|nr:Metallo-dependent phosphatase-like protein [Gautieria morchelliformis]